MLEIWAASAVYFCSQVISSTETPHQVCVMQVCISLHRVDTTRPATWDRERSNSILYVLSQCMSQIICQTLTLRILPCKQVTASYSTLFPHIPYLYLSKFPLARICLSPLLKSSSSLTPVVSVTEARIVWSPLLEHQSLAWRVSRVHNWLFVTNCFEQGFGRPKWYGSYFLYRQHAGN